LNLLKRIRQIFLERQRKQSAESISKDIKDIRDEYKHAQEDKHIQRKNFLERCRYNLIKDELTQEQREKEDTNKVLLIGIGITVATTSLFILMGLYQKPDSQGRWFYEQLANLTLTILGTLIFGAVVGWILEDQSNKRQDKLKISEIEAELISLNAYFDSYEKLKSKAKKELGIVTKKPVYTKVTFWIGLVLVAQFYLFKITPDIKQWQQLIGQILGIGILIYSFFKKDQQIQK